MPSQRSPPWATDEVVAGLVLLYGQPVHQFRCAGGNTVEEAVAVIVAMASITADGPPGTFTGNDGLLPS